MTYVPSIGYSRVESVNFCLTDLKVQQYQDLTDAQLDKFNKCLEDLT